MQNLQLSFINIEDLKAVLPDIVSVAITKELEALKKPVEDEYLTRAQTAKKLGIALSTLHEYTLAGIITAYRLGSRVRYKRTEVEQSLTQIKTAKKGGIA